MKLICCSLCMLYLCFAQSSWQPLGPYSATCLAMGVSSTNDDLIYVAAGDADNSIFKSIDGGVSWDRTGNIPDQIYWVNCLAVDPVDLNVAYASVDRMLASHFVYKTTDGGTVWTGLAVPDSCGSIANLIIHPTSPSTIFAVGRYQTTTNFFMGFFLSTDGGITWAAKQLGVNRGEAYCIGLDPTNPDVIYVGGYYYNPSAYAAIFRSTDGGENFSDISPGLSGTTVNAVAVHRTNPDLIIAGTDVGIDRSTDGGNSWSPVYSCPQIKCISTSPAAPDVIYAAAHATAYKIPDSVHKSTDAGVSWFETGPGIHGLEVLFDLTMRSDDAAIVYLASYTGFYKTTNSGTSWFESVDGMEGPIWITCLGVAPSSPTIIYTSGNGLALDYKTVNSGRDWRRLDINYGGSFCAYAVHNTNPDIVFGISSFG